MRLVQPGTGIARPLAIIYHLTSGSAARPSFIDDRVRLAVGDKTAVVNITAPVPSGKATTGSAYRRIGNVAADGSTLLDLDALVRKYATELGAILAPIVLVGFSEGCQGPRAQLLAGKVPDAIVAIDGIHGAFPTPDAETEVKPWQDFFDAAEASKCIAIASHTQIPTEPSFLRGRRMLETITRTQWDLSPGASREAPAFHTSGKLRIYSYPGETAADHAYQAQTALSVHLRECFVMLGLQPADEPMPVDGPPLASSTTIPLPPIPSDPSSAVFLAGVGIASALAAWFVWQAAKQNPPLLPSRA